jgi:excisionase family DNA binding protein
MPNLLTRKQVAEYLKVSYLTVYRWEQAGKLPALRIGAGSIRYRHADVDQFITAAVRP